MSSSQEAYSRCHKGLTLFSDEPHTRFGSPPTIGILQGGFRSPLQLSWGTHPQLNWGLPNSCRSFTTRSLRGTSNRLGYTMHPRGTSSWEHNAPKSNKLLNFDLHVSPRREQPDATNAKRQENTKCSSPSLPNSNQSKQGQGQEQEGPCHQGKG